MLFQIDCVIMGENDLHLLVIDQVVDGASLPVSDLVPAFSGAGYELWIMIAKESGRRHITNIIDDGLIQGFGMEGLIIIDIHGG